MNIAWCISEGSSYINMVLPTPYRRFSISIPNKQRDVEYLKKRTMKESYTL